MVGEKRKVEKRRDVRKQATAYSSCAGKTETAIPLLYMWETKALPTGVPLYGLLLGASSVWTPGRRQARKLGKVHSACGVKWLTDVGSD